MHLEHLPCFHPSWAERTSADALSSVISRLEYLNPSEALEAAERLIHTFPNHVFTHMIADYLVTAANEGSLLFLDFVADSPVHSSLLREVMVFHPRPSLEPLFQGYGMSENAAAFSVSTVQEFFHENGVGSLEFQGCVAHLLQQCFLVLQGSHMSLDESARQAVLLSAVFCTPSPV